MVLGWLQGVPLHCDAVLPSPRSLPQKLYLSKTASQFDSQGCSLDASGHPWSTLLAPCCWPIREGTVV